MTARFTRSYLAAALAAAVCLGAAGLAGQAFAKDEKKPAQPIYLDPNEAGPDYKVQGEYVGVVVGKASKKVGVQVIALGDGKFRACFLKGGLPGAGWDGKTKVEIEGKTDGEKTVFDEKGREAVIEGDRLVARIDKGERIRAERIVRTSPTLGAKPPAGAVVLFDGTDAKAWRNGHMDKRKRLAAGVKSKKSFGDFTLHAEFMTPFKPHGRGQGRGNSGVYLQDRYEVQVLDSFGLAGRNNECGGVYSKADPKVNMCLPPLTWQTYDFDFQAARFDADGKKTKNAVVTIRHNGVVIHDKLEINGPTGGGKKENAQGGPIQLQGHGNPVFYRNIWVVEKN